MAEDQQNLAETVAAEATDTATEVVEETPTTSTVEADKPAEEAEAAPVRSDSDLPENPSIGYKGEIVGRVLKLEDLDIEELGASAEQYSELARMIDQTLTNVSAHEIVTGRIVSIGEKDVVIDIGFKSDGIVSRNEFGEELESGQEVEVFLERIEDYHGQLVLSKT